MPFDTGLLPHSGGHARMLYLGQLFYAMLPVYAANMAPPFVKYWRGWNRPINAHWLGSHKTVVGFAAGVAVAVAVTFLQSRLDWKASLIRADDWLLPGLAAGAGAMCGDSIKSFFKRRLRIAPGHPWIPFDQLDFVAGGLLALAYWVHWRFIDIAWILSLSFVADIAVNHLSFYIGIRDTKW